MTNRTFAALAVFAALAGGSCGAVGEDARVQLLVKSTRWAGSDSPWSSAMAGTANLAVTLRVSNQSSTPLSLAPNHFELETADGYVYRGNPLSSSWPAGCNASASVMAGATIECTELFSLSSGAQVSKVGYAFDDQATSMVRLAVTACTWCGAQCVDLLTDANHCGACNRPTTSGHCEAGKPACGGGLTACGADCVDLQTDAQNCGACGRHAWGGTCINGALSCGSTSLTACGETCTSLSSDATNCGRCGAACPATYACVASQCQCAAGTSVCGAGCVDRTTDSANCGTCGHVCASGQYCSSGTCVTGSGGGTGGGSGGGCHVDCSQLGLSCCGSSCC